MDKSLRDKFDLRILIPTDKAAREYENYRLQRCLWHADEDPSLLIFRDGYHCQSCGVRGDVVDWTQFSEGLSFGQALDLLRQREPSIVLPPRKRDRKPLPTDLADKYHTSLTEHAVAYYHSRGLNDESILKHRLGYGIPPGQTLPRFSVPVYSSGTLVNIKFRRDDSCPSCASFSQVSRDDQLCCKNCGRLWTPDGPKYLGVQGHSAPTIFNDTALTAPDVLIVEGEFDAIAVSQWGYAAITSTGGAHSFRAEWAALFHPMQRLFAIYDNDDAGAAGRKRLHTLFKNLRDVYLPVAHKGDITDFICQHGGKELCRVIQEANQRYHHQKQLRLLQSLLTQNLSPSRSGPLISQRTTG